MMKKIGILAFAIMVVSLVCTEIGMDKVFPKAEPRWPGTVVTMKMMRSFGDGYEGGFEFSTDGKLVCNYLYPWNSDYPEEQYFQRRVYDLQGNEIKEAVDADEGFLTPQYRKRFRLAVPAASQGHDDMIQRVEPLFREIWRLLPCMELLLQTNSWRLSDDQSAVLCLMSPAMKKEPCKTLELWTLEPTPQKKWSATLKEGFYSRWEYAGFYRREGKDYLVIAQSLADHSLILAAEDGAVAGRVEHPEDGARAPQDHRVGSTYDMEPEQRLLAVTQDRRVKVYSLDPPYALRSQYVLPEPYAGDAAAWCAAHVQFAGGQYLVVDYIREYKRGLAFRFAQGPGNYKEAHATIIYDLPTGRPVWVRYGKEEQPVKLSPDGKKLAIRKGRRLEVGDFAPQGVDKPAKRKGRDTRYGMPEEHKNRKRNQENTKDAS